MKHAYVDIRSRIKETPTWFDANGVPRYGLFHPVDCPNIYAHTVVLLRIGCQGCNEKFLVGVHDSTFAPIHSPRELCYGDPPIHDCVGDTMNSFALEVLEVWHREAVEDWKRVHELEGAIDERD